MASRLFALLAVAVAALCLSTGSPAASDEERAAKQAELDAACEAAREKKLAPLRQQLIDECVKRKEFETREQCEAYYADWNGQRGTRAPLFYDLPPCVKAFEYAQSERSGE